MSFKADNKAFEKWLRTQCDVVEEDLAYKHEQMAEDAFVFLRATFFRWAKQIETLCPELAGAPNVVSVGDTHVENFGTWRDTEGRLVWGVNDFDEAASIPYPFDLVRLATSIRLAPKPKGSNREAAAAILKGYGGGLEEARPTLLDEQETWMRPYVVVLDKKRKKFWKDIYDYPKATPPPKVVNGLKKSLPEGAVISHFISWTKGVGSLGRPRFAVIARWRGGHVVREAKALVPSAWDWAHGRLSARTRFLDLALGIFRSPDPSRAARDVAERVSKFRPCRVPRFLPAVQECRAP